MTNDTLAKLAAICEEIALKHQQDEGTYAAGKKAGALECAEAIRALTAQAPDHFVDADKMVQHTRAAQALPAAEPVAEVHSMSGDFGCIKVLQKLVAFPGDKLYTTPQAAQKAAQAPVGRVPIEAAEEDGSLYVVSWIDPEDGLERHDFDTLEDGVWQQHADNVEHFQMCAPPGSRGPKEQPPYTHCLKLSALPQPPQPQGDA